MLLDAERRIGHSHFVYGASGFSPSAADGESTKNLLASKCTSVPIEEDKVCLCTACQLPNLLTRIAVELLCVASARLLSTSHLDAQGILRSILPRKMARSRKYRAVSSSTSELNAIVSKVTARLRRSQQVRSCLQAEAFPCQLRHSRWQSCSAHLRPVFGSSASGQPQMLECVAS